MTADIGSRTVDWYSVHLFVVPLLDQAGGWPLAGSLAWQHLPDDDPAKLAAVLDAGRHWALHVDCRQTVFAETSRDIAAAADWPAIAREIHRRSGARINREVA